MQKSKVYSSMRFPARKKTFRRALASAIVWATVTARSRGNRLYNLCWLRLVHYDRTKARPLVLVKENYKVHMWYNRCNLSLQIFCYLNYIVYCPVWHCVITCLDEVLCLSLSAREGQELAIDTSRTLVRELVCDREAAPPSYYNDLIDLRNRFVENHNSCKRGYLRIGKVERLQILTIVWQTSPGHGTNYLM